MCDLWNPDPFEAHRSQVPHCMLQITHPSAFPASVQYLNILYNI